MLAEGGLALRGHEVGSAELPHHLLSTAPDPVRRGVVDPQVPHLRIEHVIAAGRVVVQVPQFARGHEQLAAQLDLLGEVDEARHRNQHASRRITKRSRPDADPAAPPLGNDDAHQASTLRLAGAQGNHGGTFVARPGAFVFVDGLPARVERTAAQQLIPRQPEHGRRGLVGVDHLALATMPYPALAQGIEQRSVPRIHRRLIAHESSLNWRDLTSNAPRKRAYICGAFARQRDRGPRR